MPQQFDVSDLGVPGVSVVDVSSVTILGVSGLPTGSFGILISRELKMVTAIILQTIDMEPLKFVEQRFLHRVYIK